VYFLIKRLNLCIEKGIDGQEDPNEDNEQTLW